MLNYLPIIAIHALPLAVFASYLKEMRLREFAAFHPLWQGIKKKVSDHNPTVHNPKLNFWATADSWRESKKDAKKSVTLRG